MAQVQKESKNVIISKLLKALGRLTSGTTTEARTIRAKLRSLDHYVSKKKPAAAKVQPKKEKKPAKAISKKRRDPDLEDR
jgi:hypothetical protein